MTKPETPAETAASEATTLLIERTEAAPLPPPPAAPPLPPLERKATFQMISMKSPAELAAETARVGRPIAAVQMRSLAEAGRHVPTPPGGLGFLAPPRDPAAEPKGLSGGAYVLLMALGALALAAVIASAMWFLAYR